MWYNRPGLKAFFSAGIMAVDLLLFYNITLYNKIQENKQYICSYISKKRFYELNHVEYHHCNGYQ